MKIEIPGNVKEEYINLPNGQFVQITYLQENDLMALPDGRYISPYRSIRLFDEEDGILLGESIERNPWHDIEFYNTVFEHLEDEIEYE